MFTEAFKKVTGLKKVYSLIVSLQFNELNPYLYKNLVFKYYISIITTRKGSTLSKIINKFEKLTLIIVHNQKNVKKDLKDHVLCYDKDLVHNIYLLFYNFPLIKD